MPRPTATRTFGVDAEDVLAIVTDVTRLPEFLEGLDAVSPLGHRRWRWDARYCGRVRQVDVLVTVELKDNRVAWKALHRPAFDGELRVEPKGPGLCRVTLALQVEPRGFVEGFAEMAGLTGWMADRDLQRLAGLLGATNSRVA